MQCFLWTAVLLISGLVISVPGQTDETLRDKRRLDSNTKVKPQIDEVSKPKAPQGYELRCRGGLTIDDFQRVSEKTTSSGEVIVMSMTLLAETERAAGQDSSGLNPGFCGWIDRPMNRNEAFDSNTGIGRKLIYFETSGRQARTIPEYMKDASHYWSFFGGFKDGNFHASSHRGWTKPPASDEMKKGIMEVPKKP